MSEPIKTPENTESLFLLELLFDTVEIDYPKLNLDCNVLKSLKQACVRFQFLNYPVLEVCEEDFCNTPEDYQKDKIQFKSGKSCLFSLHGLPLDIRCLDVCLSVVRQRDCEPCFELGKARISLGSSFTNILSSLDDSNQNGSVSKNSKDTHPLLNAKGEIVGKVTAFIRLSCFGKLIITQFQVSGDENKSFLFKGAANPIEGGEELCRPEQSTVSDPYIREKQSPGGDASRSICKDAQPPDCNVGPIQNQGMFNCDASATQDPFSPIDIPGFQGMPGYQMDLPPNFQGGMPNFQNAEPNFQNEMPSFQGVMPGVPGSIQGYPGGVSGLPGMQGLDPYGYQQGLPNTQGTISGYPGFARGAADEENEEEQESDFKEIGVEINGHSLSIKVPKRKKKAKVENPPIPFCGKICESESSSESEEPAPAPVMPDLNFCSCDVPFPPGFGAPPPPQPKKKKKKKPKCPMEQQNNYCLKTDCPMGLPPLPNFQNKTQPPPFQTPPGGIGVKGDQVIFQMANKQQTGFDTNANARYSFTGNAESNLQKVQMMTDNEAAATCGPSPYNDVFLLKVGQKNLETGRRSMMNVQVKSPRKEEKKLVDQETQYETAAPPAKAGKKGKGGKKGGKKGKGKKK